MNKNRLWKIDRLDDVEFGSATIIEENHVLIRGTIRLNGYRLLIWLKMRVLNGI